MIENSPIDIDAELEGASRETPENKEGSDAVDDDSLTLAPDITTKPLSAFKKDGEEPT